MLQIARPVTDSQAAALHAKRYLIIDRDTEYSEPFRRLIRANGTRVIRLPPMSPNLNAYAEQFVGSIKDEFETRPRVVQNSNDTIIQLCGSRNLVFHPDAHADGLHCRVHRPARLALDSRGDIYVGKAIYTEWPRLFPEIPMVKGLRSLQKLERAT